MDKTELLNILVNNSKVWIKDEKDQDKAMIYVDDFVKELLEAINYTHCCKSDSEQLIAFSDWVFEQPLHLGGNERKLVKQYLEGN